MLSVEKVSHKYNTLHLSAIAHALEAMVVAAEQNEISYLQFADEIVSHELTSRDKKRRQLNRKRATFPVVKLLEEFDYRFQTTVTSAEKQNC